MKSSLYLAIFFIICCVTILFVGAFAFMVYDVSMHLSAGTEVSFFNLSSFLRGFAFSIPVATVLSCFFSIFYIIKHNSHPWYNLLVYAILGLLVWFLIIPLSYKLSDVILFSDSSIETEQEDEKTLYTAGYFRKVSNGYVYFTQVHKDNTADGVIIVKGNASTFKEIPLTSFFDDISRDSLFDSAIKPTGVVNFIISFLKLFWEIGKYSYMGKGLYLVAFLSFGMSLLSVIGLIRCSDWRLCNMCYVIVSFLFLCVVNYLIYDSKFFVSVIRFFIDKEIDFLSDRRVLQLIINSVVFCAFSAIGIVNVFRKPNANQELIAE